MFINRGAEPQKPQQCFTSPLRAGKSKGDRGLKVGKYFQKKKKLIVLQGKYLGHRCQSFHFSQKDKHLNPPQMPKAAPALTSEGGKVSISQFFW